MFKCNYLKIYTIAQLSISAELGSLSDGICLDHQSFLLLDYTLSPLLLNQILGHQNSFSYSNLKKHLSCCSFSLCIHLPPKIPGSVSKGLKVQGETQISRWVILRVIINEQQWHNTPTFLRLHHSTCWNQSTKQPWPI